MKKMYFNWSTGKDAALSLHYIQQEKQFDVDHLLVTLNKSTNRVSMHGLSRTLMLEQIKSVGLNFTTVELPEKSSMKEYAELMGTEVKSLKKKGYNHTGFGDIFLEDLRAYRENQLKEVGIQCHFPLWKKDTYKIIHEFIDLGFKAVVVSINSNKLDKSFCGREIDKDFMADLPKDIDPCGENGEFHTFCYDGPIFNEPILFEKGNQVFKSYPNPSSKKVDFNDDQIGFWFQDLELLK